MIADRNPGDFSRRAVFLLALSAVLVLLCLAATRQTFFLFYWNSDVQLFWRSAAILAGVSLALSLRWQAVFSWPAIAMLFLLQSIPAAKVLLVLAPFVSLGDGEYVAFFWSLSLLACSIAATAIILNSTKRLLLANLALIMGIAPVVFLAIFSIGSQVK